MTDQRDTTVLVVGAGPTGLAAAVELGRRGVDCRVVERESAAVESSRALAIQPRTLQLFDDMGVGEQILEEGFRVTGATVYDGDTEVFRLDVDALTETPYPFLWWLPQNHTERILLDRLADLGIDVEFERELTGFGQRRESVTARVADATADEDAEAETITARWLLGCDGAHSRVRRTLGETMEGVTTSQQLLLADVALDWDRPSEEGAVWLHENGVVAALPMLGDQTWRLFVDVTPIPEPYRPDADSDVLQRTLRRRTSNPEVTVTETLWTSTYVANQRMVDRYRHGRVFLAGDAAHVHNPLGGQGMNLGIQDAYNLVWKLALVESGRAPDRLLDTYETERTPAAAAVIRQTGVTGSVVIAENSLVRRVRGNLLPLVVERPRFQRLLFRSISMLETNYRESPLSRVDVQSPVGGLVSRSHTDADSLDSSGTDTGLVGTVTSFLDRARRSWNAPRAGDRAPNASCRLLDGTETSLYELLHSRTRFTLLLFPGSAADVCDLTSLARSVDPDLIEPVLVVSEKGDASTADGPAVEEAVADGSAVEEAAVEGATVVVDDGQFHERYGASRSTLFLLRPDDYVALRAQPAERAPLDSYTRAWIVE